ncbi:MAG: hypothetical protein RL023_928 [Candidatus Parcubacteria bacterium]
MILVRYFSFFHRENRSDVVVVNDYRIDDVLIPNDAISVLYVVVFLSYFLLFSLFLEIHRGILHH